MSHEKADAFYAHLDVCKRCDDRPFDLCPIGALLLIAAGKEVAEELTHAR